MDQDIRDVEMCQEQSGLRRSARLRGREPLGNVDLDDSVSITPLATTMVYDTTSRRYGKAEARRVTVNDGTTDVDICVQFLDWILSSAQGELCVFEPATYWLHEDDCERLGEWKGRATTYRWLMALRKARVAATVMLLNDRNAAAVVGSSNALVDALGTLIVHSYWRSDHVRGPHFGLGAFVHFPTAIAAAVTAVLRERVGDSHSGFTRHRTDADYGFVKQLRLRNPAAVKVFGTNECRRPHGRGHKLCVYNLVVEFKRVATIPRLSAKFDVFEERRDGTRVGIIHTDPMWNTYAQRRAAKRAAARRRERARQREAKATRRLRAERRRKRKR